MSLGLPQNSQVLSDVIQYAHNKGVILVAAVGNDGRGDKNYPAAYDEVIAVAALDSDGTRASFSNWGSWTDFSTFGRRILSTKPEGKYGMLSGSSQASPQVAGVFALMRGLYPKLASQELNKKVKKALKDVNDTTGSCNGGCKGQLGKNLKVGEIMAKFFPVTTKEKKEEVVLLVEEEPQVSEKPKVAFTEKVEEIIVFSDLSATHKNRTAILYLKDRGIVGGYEDGTFQPRKTVNRAELLKILVEGKGVKPSDFYENCFPDVTTEWFAPYICYAKKQGWISGYPDGTFRPGQEVNRVETIKMLLNSQEIDVEDAATVELSFRDVDDDAWYVPFIQKAVKLNLLEEKTRLSPGGGKTRAALSENLYRALMIKQMGWSEFQI